MILTYGPYAKGLAFQEGYPDQWKRMVEQHPDVAAGSSNIYQNWEVVDPEKWVPEGYVCLTGGLPRCRQVSWVHRPLLATGDSRPCRLHRLGSGTVVVTGKVGLNGISYYGINQWHVASLQPPALAAMCVWEGAADWYRDMTHHGGIVSTFWPTGTTCR